MGDTHSKCRATSIEVKFTGRKIWGRWVEDPDGPWTFPVGDKYWQWCREEGPAEAYWRRGFGVITKWNKAGLSVSRYPALGGGPWSLKKSF